MSNAFGTKQYDKKLTISQLIYFSPESFMDRLATLHVVEKSAALYTIFQDIDILKLIINR